MPAARDVEEEPRNGSENISSTGTSVPASSCVLTVCSKMIVSPMLRTALAGIGALPGSRVRREPLSGR